MCVNHKIKEMEPWFQNIHLPNGIQTAPHHFLGDFPFYKWEKIKNSIPVDLTGWQVLDVGCNAGFYSVELAKRGANVVAIDTEERYLKQAQWVVSQFGLEDKVTFKQMQIYDLAHTEETFDLVWFMGIFYHLRYPLLALDILTQRISRMLVFQSLSIPDTNEIRASYNIEINSQDIETHLAGETSHLWAPNHQCVLAMLKNGGFEIREVSEKETYIAVKKDFKTNFNSWNYTEYLSATGKEWKERAHDKKNNDHDLEIKD